MIRSQQSLGIDRGPQLLIINFHCDVFNAFLDFRAEGYCEQNSCCQQLVWDVDMSLSLDARKVGQVGEHTLSHSDRWHPCEQ